MALRLVAQTLPGQGGPQLVLRTRSVGLDAHGVFEVSHGSDVSGLPSRTIASLAS